MKKITITISILLITIIANQLYGQTVLKKSEEKTVHIVLFKFKEGTTIQEIQSLKHEILKQKNIIPGLLEISFGEDSTGRAKGFTHAEVAVFEDNEFLEKFNKSDYHAQLIDKYIKPILFEILVLDYEQKK